MSIRHPYASPPSSYLYANVPYHDERTINQYRITQINCTTARNNHYYYYYRPPSSQLRSFVPSLSSDSLPSWIPTSRDDTAGGSNADSNLGFSGHYPNRKYPPQTSHIGISGRVRIILKDFGESMRTRRLWGASPRNPYVSRVHIRAPALLCCCDVRIDDYERSAV